MVGTLGGLTFSRAGPLLFDSHNPAKFNGIKIKTYQGGGAGIQAADIIGGLANGQGIGLGSLNNPNPIPNFDIRSSLAGRVLGATGAIADTNLGIIGGKQLALLLVNNAAFNVQQSILGKLNIKENISIKTLTFIINLFNKFKELNIKIIYIMGIKNGIQLKVKLYLYAMHKQWFH